MFQIERGEPLVAIGAWCLMPNHFHFLCKEITEGGLQKFFHKLCTGYSMYFNTKHARTGTLFEGRFKAQHVDSDRYLKYLHAYIYLNPVKLVPGESSWKETGIQDMKAVKDFLEKYPYSSMPRIGNNNPLKSIIAADYFPHYYENLTEMAKEVLEWLTYL
jgi:putative transposase